MALRLVTGLIILTSVSLIALVILMYIRSLQGDRRVINVANQMVLPVLSGIVITVSIIFSNPQASQVCEGPLNILRYTGVIAAISLISIGVLRFFVGQSRDRRLIIHPILFTVIIVTVVFLVEYLNGCL